MRNSYKFRELLVKYLRASHSEKSQMIENLRKSAKKFFDFALLFQFDRHGREETFDKMKETYLQERYPIRVQRNLLDLFSAIDEWNDIHEYDTVDKKEFLEAFYKKCHARKDDLLFYLAESEGCGRYESKAEKKLLKLYYATEVGMVRGINAKVDRNTKMSIASPFGKNSMEVLSAI